MRKHIVITLILLALTAYVTVIYFKNLNSPETHAASVISEIPDSAPLIFEFNNDNGFYDIFKGDTLLSAITGKSAVDELDTLRRRVLQNAMLIKYFAGQNIFISIHPLADKKIGLLLTLSAGKGFTDSIFNAVEKQPDNDLSITQSHNAANRFYTIYIKTLGRPFYLAEKDENVFSGSFSADLAQQAVNYKPQKGKKSYVLLPDQQRANSLANLYVNYAQFDPLISLLFKNRNTDIFKNFRSLPAFAALTLNYKSGALVFDGSTSISPGKPTDYLRVFANQRPVINHLKDIFPSTSAYSTNFSVSDPVKFSKDLAASYVSAGLKNEEDQLFNIIQAETGINITSRFNSLLGDEFAIVTTRYFEKLAIIAVKDGSKMNSLLMNISKMTDISSGQFSYDKLPFFLLGDAFGVFKHPYFMIIDNYLVLANSTEELKSYNDSYLNQKFLSKNDQYRLFDNLVAAQSNVAFLLILKNAEPLFERDMNDDFLHAIRTNEPGWKNFYAASWQFSAVDKNFYTNFCLKLKTDTVLLKN